MYHILCKTVINKKCNNIKTEVFFYLSVTANLSSGGKAFLILVFWKVRLGPSTTSSWSKVALDILKYLKKHVWISLQVFVQGVEFPLRNLWLVIGCTQNFFSFLYFSLSKQQSTHQCYIRAVHIITESVQGDCFSKARPRIKNKTARARLA
jgi:hypothetical protein